MVIMREGTTIPQPKPTATGPAGAGENLTPGSVVNVHVHAPGSTAIPMDAEGRVALQQAAAARNEYLQSLVQQRQADQAEYGQNLHAYTEQHPLDEDTLGANASGSGTLFSTGFGNQLGQLNQKYSEAVGNLKSNENQSLSDLIQNRQSYNNEYGTDISAIQQAAAERLAANQATLGLTKGGQLSPAQISKLLNGQ